MYECPRKLAVIAFTMLLTNGCGSTPFDLLQVCTGADGGRIDMSDTQALVAGEPGELRFVWRAGQDGMMPGDALRFELPTAWYTKRSCPNLDNTTGYQTDQAELPNYFGLVNVDESTRFSMGVIRQRRLDGRFNRFKTILSARLTRGTVAPGEVVEFVVRGWHVDGQPVVPVAGGDGLLEGQLVLASRGPCTAQMEPDVITVDANGPYELLVSAPSVSSVDDILTLKLRLLDEYYNACPNWHSGINLDVPDGITGIPDELSIDTLNEFGGLVTLPFQVDAPGSYVITVQYGDWEPVASNPIKVVAESTPEHVYWGDLHAHSEISKDGMGLGSFIYARDASLLDFFAVTEHHTQEDNPFDPPTLLPAHVWEAIKQDVRDYYDPGRFVTLLAFENTGTSPSGHQNVYYPNADAPLLLVGQLNETWEAVRQHSGFIIQHHTGIIFHRRGGNFFLSRLFALFVAGAWVGWDAFPDVPRPAIEIYSLHGQSEYYNPNDALSYEQHGLQLPRDPTQERCGTGVSRVGPHYARNAWAAGLMLGVVAGSDDHRAQPGKAGGGLTAVRTTELTRDAVFSAINNRSTYATTGDRIILDFRINGHGMGANITSADPPQIEIEVIGTAPIEYLQVMKHEVGQTGWSVLHETRDHAPELTLSIEDEEFTGETIYYVRLQQTNITRGRAVRAWSSPIWVRDAE